MHSIHHWLTTIFMALFLVGCGGSSSSPAVPGSQATGGLTVVVGDAPADDFDAILLTIEDIILIGADGQLDLELEEPKEVDLLQLRSLTELLIDTEVPVGDYSKIRLLVSELVLQVKDEEGNVLSTETPPLPANGKIDLNPQGAFTIRRGEDLVVEIDFDLDRSLKITSTGSGQYRFRPVVFVDVVTQASARLVRLEGTIANLAEPDKLQFDLCEDATQSDDCVPVSLSAEALIVDEAGTVFDEQALMNDLVVTLFGRFTDEERFDAQVIAYGDAAALTQLEGTVSEAPGTTDPDNLFTLLVESEDVPVMLLERTLLLDSEHQPTTADAIALGIELEAWVIQLEGENAIALVIQLDEDNADEMEVEGRLVAYEDGIFNLLTESQEEICVRADAQTAFVEFFEDTDTAESIEFDLATFEERLDVEYLEVELEIEVEGLFNDGCYDATTLVIEIED